MRVAFASFRATRDGEGVPERRMRRIAELLAERGHEVTVLCTKWWDGFAPERTVDGVRYLPLTVAESERSFATKLPTALLRLDPDVIHVGQSPPSQITAAGVGSTLARAPLVVDWYGDIGFDGGRLSRRAITTADAVITPSRMVKTHARELGVSGDAVSVIPDPIDVERVRAIEPSGSADVVYSRRLDGDANVGILLLALAEYRDRDWETVIVGDGPERRRYERQARDLRIEDRVTFAGALPFAERVALFKGAHVFVQTARRESFARELLLALACGCVGVVEYQARSSAHEFVEQFDRGFRTTTDSEITDRILEAGRLPHREYDETFDEYGDEPVLDRILDCYRSVQSESVVLSQERLLGSE